ncbi:spore coat protein [Sporomusa termitida]|uniref:Coat F domain protein n=1 Tax=Sporomusa termitida TaxID=2377 RepID=A0A517DRE8_9FIRM|nr:spore coat protein [Sporomusa termitida]QDR79932.1 Coat F domain protein [Sporomusa termitida]
MVSLMGSIFPESSGEAGDRTIAYNATYGAAATAQAYFSAALAATTPEVRALLAGYCSQGLTGHEGIMNYMIQKKWVNPYDQPERQLSTAVQESLSSFKAH